VNLERAISMQTRIGGHYVQGHVDGMGEILSIQADQQSDALLVKISVPAPFSKYLVNKGYIALDGMSITLIDCQPEWFTVTFISYTQQHTIVQHYKKGHFINLEVDILGKYVEKLLRGFTHANAN
jgi:riboflavin synthase